ncbi:hypothetical protein LTR15_010849 [Elasticomyces elasticus]|nr:hypothetical protein LTR15_010849 [Elasticomyces elasticus]
MHFTAAIAAAVLAFTSAAVAYDPRAASEAINAGAPIKWTGKIFAERDDYTLHGGAKSIHEQIRAIRSDFNPNEFRTPLQRRNVAKRDFTNIGSCGGFATVWMDDMEGNGALFPYIGGRRNSMCITEP